MKIQITIEFCDLNGNLTTFEKFYLDDEVSAHEWLKVLKLNNVKQIFFTKCTS